MNDLELMLMLEEYGYEPSIENVKFLKEDLDLLDEDYLDEGVRDAVKTYFAHSGNIKKRKQEYKNAVRTNRAAKQGVKDAERYVGSHAEHDVGGRLGDALDVKEKTQADVSASKQALKIARDRRSNAVSNALHNEPIHKNEEVPMKELVKSKETPHITTDYKPRQVKKLRIQDERLPSERLKMAKRGPITAKRRPNKTRISTPISENVEYSDYELYQLLDESGYKPTEKNLYLLKEGLESGKYEIIDEGFHPIKALQIYRFYTKNYVKPNKKNAEIAKNDPESTEQNTNYWQNRYLAAKEERKTATRIALTDRIPKEKSKKD